MTVSADDEGLYDREWIHVFERDTAEGAVFVPADADIPLSRRPRERLALRRDGSATVFVAGADDRLVERPASWSIEGQNMVVRTRGGVAARVIDHSGDRLLVQLR